MSNTQTQITHLYSSKRGSEKQQFRVDAILGVWSMRKQRCKDMLWNWADSVWMSHTSNVDVTVHSCPLTVCSPGHFYLFCSPFITSCISCVLWCLILKGPVVSKTQVDLVPRTFLLTCTLMKHRLTDSAHRASGILTFVCFQSLFPLCPATTWDSCYITHMCILLGLSWSLKNHRM